MKLQVAALGIVLASLLSAPAMAGFGAGADRELPMLDSGISSSYILSSPGHPQRFQINIDQPTTLRVASDHFPGESSVGVRITARLYDDSGRLVEEATSPRGHFKIERQVQPGNYVLEVSGASTGAKREGMRDRYELHVSY
ncbi:hypothetical protein [Halomonas sp. E19]|uniref:hypothetical protein n=1 Tax=Halomonas sp. E19 TaxID=3397247 RepID=UPI0040337CE0